MYWSRTGNGSQLLAIAVLCILWWIGGWLIATHVFRLRSKERLLVGLALGLSLFIVFSALLTYVLEIPAAFWISSILILALGLLSSSRSRKPIVSLKDFKSWPLLLILGILILIFASIHRGLAIFDDYHNLPLISVMATGDIPPHYYLNPDLRFAYHFGLHLFAATLMRVGGFFPWSAFDLVNAFAIALSLLLGFLYFQRRTRSALAASLGTLALAFAGGALWLLLMMPVPWLIHLSEKTELIGTALATGPDLYTNLSLPWIIEGGGPMPYPFAYVSGVMSPLVMSITGRGAFPLMVPLLMLLLVRRRWDTFSGLIFAAVFASLALTAETVFILLFVGIAAAFLIAIWQRSGGLNRRQWVVLAAWTLISAALLAAVVGGVFTEIIRSTLNPGISAGVGFDAFTFNWPPAQPSVHFGAMSFFDPDHLVLILVELGAVILLAPSVTVWSWRRLKRGDWFSGGMGITALLAFCIPLVFHYAILRDTVRITETALRIWFVLGFPIIWAIIRDSKNSIRALAGVWFGILTLGGVVMLSISMISIPNPVQSYYLGGQDARLSRAHWDQLEEDAQILDRFPFRSVTLFGRAAYAHQGFREPL